MTYRKLKRDKTGRWTEIKPFFTPKNTVKALLVLFMVYVALYALHSVNGTIPQDTPQNVPNELIEPHRALDEQTCMKVDKDTYCYDKPSTLKWVWEEEGKSKVKPIVQTKVVKPELKRRAGMFEVSAYTSRAQETDSSPTIAANGKNIWELYKKGINTCATNDYKFGTKLFVTGLGECVVNDRMNRRYTGKGNVDFYFGYDLKAALTFGRRTLAVQVLN